MLTDKQREQISGWDQRLSVSAKKVRILGPLAWPLPVEEAFLDAWDRGARILPTPPPVVVDYTREIAELHTLMKEIDAQHPLGAFLHRTAQSYLSAAKMISAAGKPEFTRWSVVLYGEPRGMIVPGAPSHLDAAEQFLSATRPIQTGPLHEEELSAEEAAAWMQARIDQYFSEKHLPVEIHDDLAALASAGAKRVRLRGQTRYAEVTLAQLLNHEALVHTATKRNGRAQPLLTSLGLSAPRTTTTQEGLATLSEMITDTMDLSRLRRIALRIKAVDVALQGADFCEVFELLLAHGQSAIEAFRSAARVFRGGDVSGQGVVFTKDIVYLKGLMLTHTFLLKAMQSGHAALPLRLFAGRMTLGDAVTLEPFFASGDLIEPKVVPPWIENLPCLAAYLTWAAFSNRIPIGDIQLADFFTVEEALAS